MKHPPLAIVCLLVWSTAATAATTYYTHPYYSRSDSPFYQGIVDGTIYLEDFEDYRLNTPYVTSTGGGWVADSPNHSVDGDDGVLNGRTSGGGCWTIRPSDRIAPEFNFTRNEQGLLPSYAGAALLVGRYDFIGANIYTMMRVYDGAGNEVTNGEWKVVLPLASLDAFSSAGDAFVGIYYPDGISRIEFGWGLIDHLQYGYAVAEPTATGLLAVAGCFGLAARRRGAPRFRAPTPSSSATAPPPPMPG